MTRKKIRNNSGKQRYDYQLRAERALEKPLPDGVIVHHFSEENIVLCEDRAYHNLIHRRLRSLESCGHADWLKCEFCKKYDNPSNLLIYKRKDRDSFIAHHRECSVRNQEAKRRKGGQPIRGRRNKIYSGAYSKTIPSI